MTLIEKILAFLGFLGFVVLCPQLFYIFGIEGPQIFLEQHLGAFGDKSTLSIIGCSLLTLAIFFGGGDTIGATLLGLIMGFVLITTSVDVSFMQWLRGIFSSFDYLANFQLNYVVGIFIILFGIGLSYIPKLSFKLQTFLLVLLPILFIMSSQAMGYFQFEREFDISVDKGISSLTEIINEKYQNLPGVQNFLKKVEEDEELSDEQKQAKIEGLQEKIVKIEEDKSDLEKLKEENEKFKELIEKQKNELASHGWCSSAKDTGNQTKSFAEAVQPNQPCVRDFAVSVVKEYQGSFSEQNRGIPGKQGALQICAMHLHLSSNWNYISDPTILRDDYYSKADRTIAVGLAGDCDDFSVLTASCIEAIGGTSRIMAGSCDGGGHAWCEVLIGTKENYEKVATQVRNFYQQETKVLTPTIDESGNYWLVLDWRIGEYTCNKTNLTVLYHSRDQLNQAL